MKTNPDKEKTSSIRDRGRTSPVGMTGVAGLRSRRSQTPGNNGLRQAAVVPFSSALGGTFTPPGTWPLLSFNSEGRSM